MRKIFQKRVYPVRNLELPWIKKVRLRELRSIVGSFDDSGFHKFELGVMEFILLICMYECNLTELIYYLDLVIDHGAVKVHSVYTILTATLTMPLYMLLMFMSSYSKKSYLNIFSCSPLFEGLGYVIAFVKITSELFNTTLAGISLLVIYHCIVGAFKSDFCKGLVKIYQKNITCLTMHPKQPYNFTCAESEGAVRLETATQYYMRTVTLFKSLEDITFPMVNIPLLVAVTVIWAVIFLFALSGIKRIKGLTLNLQFVLGLTMTSIVLIAMFHGHNRVPSKPDLFGSEELPLFEFCVELILHTSSANCFGTFIWLGTMKPQKLDPKFAIIVTTQIKLIIYALVSCMGSIVIQDNLAHHMIVDTHCLAVSGYHILFSFIPDVLYRTSIHKLVIPLWYVVICYFSFLSPMYSIIGLVESIVQRFRTLSKYKLFVCAAICIAAYAMNVILVTDLGGYVMNCWRSCGMPVLSAAMLLLVNLAIFFVYSSKEVVDDYLFTYGIPPEKYWITLWKTSPIFAIFSFIFVMYNQYNRPDCSTADYVVIVAYIQCVSMLIPVIAFFTIKCCGHVKYADGQRMSKADDDWGPFNPNRKEERKYFHPQRDIRYRSQMLKCKHRCGATFDGPFKIKAELEQDKFIQIESEYICYKISPDHDRTSLSIDSSLD